MTWTKDLAAAIELTAAAANSRSVTGNVTPTMLEAARLRVGRRMAEAAALRAVATSPMMNRHARRKATRGLRLLGRRAS